MSRNRHNNHSRDKYRYERYEETQQKEDETVEFVSVETSDTFEEFDTPACIAYCRKLDIYETPNMDADVVAVFPEDTEIMVDEKHSTDDFYKVCTAFGIEGYCLKQYIKIRE